MHSRCVLSSPCFAMTTQWYEERIGGTFSTCIVFCCLESFGLWLGRLLWWYEGRHWVYKQEEKLWESWEEVPGWGYDIEQWADEQPDQWLVSSYVCMVASSLLDFFCVLYSGVSAAPTNVCARAAGTAAHAWSFAEKYCAFSCMRPMSFNLLCDCVWGSQSYSASFPIALV